MLAARPLTSVFRSTSLFGLRPAFYTTALPPGPQSIPEYGGTLYDLQKRMEKSGFFGAVVSYYEQYGDLVTQDMAGQKEVWVYHPEDMLACLRKEGPYPVAATAEIWPFIDAMKELNINSPFLESNEKWKHYRTIMQKDMFPPKVAESYLPRMDGPAKLASSLSPLAQAHYPDLTMLAAMDLFSSVMLGYEPKTILSLKDKSLVDPEDLNFVFNSVKSLTLGGEIFLNPQMRTPADAGPKWKEFIDSITAVLKRANECVRQIRERMKENPSEGDINTAPYLARLLQRDLDEKDASEQLANLLQAGVDTTHHVLLWLVLNLASNPEQQAKLRQELNDVLGDGPITSQNLPSLKYLKACIRESHRMSPPSSFSTFRRLPTDIELRGYNVPANTKIVFALHPIQNNPAVVDNVDKFIPERWSDDEVKKRKGTPKEVLDHALLRNPFGWGPRMCLGSRIADLEIQAFIGRLVRDWNFSLVDPNAKYERQQKLFLMAHPFPQLKFEKAN